GGERVLDALKSASGPTPFALWRDIHIARPVSSAPRAATQILPVDYAAILRGDQATNYPLMPDDRLVIPREGEKSGHEPAKGQAGAAADIRALEKRLEETERKLDQLIDALK